MAENLINKTILDQVSGLKITAGPWPFSVQNCQMAKHFSKWLAVWANPKQVTIDLQNVTKCGVKDLD